MYCAVYAYSLQAIGERLTLSVCTKRRVPTPFCGLSCKPVDRVPSHLLISF